MYFKSQFQNQELDQYRNTFKNKLMFELDTIIDNDFDNDKLRKVNKQLLEIFPVNVWNVNHENNMEIFMEVEFKKFLFSVGEFTNLNVENLSVFDFYALINHIKDKKPSGRGDNKI